MLNPEDYEYEGFEALEFSACPGSRRSRDCNQGSQNCIKATLTLLVERSALPHLGAAHC
ncbi:hypothetical protein DP42_2520 [Burkholderia pseudomallei]|nr:hypothetical protein DP42_2520 [Burkholderia pseudomallei]